MTHLEVAKKATSACLGCRDGIPLKLCPRPPKGIWQKIKFHLGFTKSFWGLAHLDLFFCREHGAILQCDAIEHIKPIIKGFKNQNPIFEDGYEDTWYDLSDELDDEEEAKKGELSPPK